jgi:hypothetical protein
MCPVNKVHNDYEGSKLYWFTVRETFNVCRIHLSVVKLRRMDLFSWNLVGSPTYEVTGKTCTSFNMCLQQMTTEQLRHLQNYQIEVWLHLVLIIWSTMHTAGLDNIDHTFNWRKKIKMWKSRPVYQRTIVYTYWLGMRLLALLLSQGSNYCPRQRRGQ